MSSATPIKERITSIYYLLHEPKHFMVGVELVSTNPLSRYA